MESIRYIFRFNCASWIHYLVISGSELEWDLGFDLGFSVEMMIGEPVGSPLGYYIEMLLGLELENFFWNMERIFGWSFT